MINTNIKKQYQQTTGLIQRLNNNIQHLSIGVIVSEKFGCRKCVCLAWKTTFCQTDMGNRLKQGQIQQGTCVEDDKLLVKLFMLLEPTMKLNQVSSLPL